ncbi:MAG: hypothetical protein ACJAZC_002405 [Cryomorphaceae bacterium]
MKIDVFLNSKLESKQAAANKVQNANSRQTCLMRLRRAACFIRLVDPVKQVFLFGKKKEFCRNVAP